MGTHRARPLLTLALASLAVGLAGARTAVAAVTDITICPYPITQPGHYRLTDTTCTGTTAITINASNVILDLNGLTVDGVTIGIDVKSGKSNIVITNGTMLKVVTGILLRGNTNVRVENVAFTENGAAVSGIASDSTFAYNQITKSLTGFFLAGKRNHFCYNEITNSLAGFTVAVHDSRFVCNKTADVKAAFAVTGDNNFIVSSTILGTSNGVGILLIGDDNIIRRNRVVGSGTGIRLSNVSDRNLVELNYVFGSSSDDLFEARVATCPNTWKKNLFVSDNEVSANEGPNAGCVQ